MTVSLTSNFFKNARGLTISDGGGVTWSFNKNTNTLSAAGSSGGVLSSVGLADLSTAPIYAVANSPLTANGTLDITLKTQAANMLFAGPTTGAAAQPTFRGLVVADLPTGIPNANLQNSSLTITAGTGLSGGGAVSLGGTVTVTLTSPVAIGNGGTGQTGAAAAYNALSPMTTLGDIEYESGTNTASRLAGNTTTTKKFLTQIGNGSVSAAPGWNTLVAGDLPANGANPTALVGLAAVIGSATTWMRSDGAPALDVTISPTWSGTHVFSNPVTIGGTDRLLLLNSSAGNNALIRVAVNNVNKFSLGWGNGTSQFILYDDAAGAYRLTVSTSGNFNFVAPTSGDLVTLNATSGGNALTVVGVAAGTAVIRLNTQAQSGAGVITIALNDYPGTNTGAKTPKYIPVNLDGSKYWIQALPD